MTLTGRLLASAAACLPLMIGLGLIYEGYRQRQTASAMAETDPSPIGSLEPGDGPVVVEGGARPLDGTVPARMLGTDAVHVMTHVQRWAPDTGGEGSPSAWRAVYSDDESVPWVIDDGTGEIAVDVPSYDDMELETASYIVETGETPPGPVQRFLDATDEVSANSDRKRRYRQFGIEDGEEVYAYGDVVEAADAPGGMVLTGAQDRFTLTDKSREAAVGKRARGGAVLYLFGGLVPFLIGAAFLFFIWAA